MSLQRQMLKLKCLYYVPEKYFRFYENSIMFTWGHVTPTKMASQTGENGTVLLFLGQVVHTLSQIHE